MKRLGIAILGAVTWTGSATAQTAPPASEQGAAAPVTPAAEPDGPRNFIAVGLAVNPKYPGSKKYSPIPLLAGVVEVAGVEVALAGPELRVDLLGGRSHFAIGPVAAVEFGRKPADGGVARRLNKIGTAASVGGFAAYRLGGNEAGQGQLELGVTALKDVTKVSRGTTVTGEASYVVVRNLRWNLAVDASVVYASGRTLRTYFGVTPTESLRSGLAAYAPGAGIESVGIGANLGYQLSSRWGVLARLGYDDLVGKAAKSPITRAGSRNQLLGGVGLSYRF